MNCLAKLAPITPAADFTRQALAETCRRGLDEWGQVAPVSDGAEWIQGFGDFHCPSAVRILDFPHAAGYVAEMGRGVFEEGSSLVDEWQREQVHRLKHEGAGPVLEDLRVLVERQETDLRKPLAYLEKREAQMQYPAFQAQGWPIGSGAVASANKLVVEAGFTGFAPISDGGEFATPSQGKRMSGAPVSSTGPSTGHATWWSGQSTG